MSESILVVGPSWVGDMIMAQSLYKALRFKHPKASIDVLAPEWSAGILQRMPEVRHVIHMPVGHGVFGWASRKQLGHSMRGHSIRGQSVRGPYDQAYVLPNSWKSALVPWFAGIPHRIGYLGEWRLGLLTQVHGLNRKRQPRLVDRYVALSGLEFNESFMPRLAINEQAQATLLCELGIQQHRPILALCAGAEFGPAKRWPARHYAALGLHYLQQGWQVWLMGSANDASTNQEILRELGCLNEVPRDGEHRNGTSPTDVVDLAGKTSLAQAADLLALASLVVTNDSGLMHLAAAVGAPVVAVYGSSDPGYTPPLSARARVARLELPCSPCFKKTCPLGHTHCLTELKPQQVLESAKSLKL